MKSILSLYTLIVFSSLIVCISCKTQLVVKTDTFIDLRDKYSFLDLIIG
jgi:hypothetical protein